MNKEYKGKISKRKIDYKSSIFESVEVSFDDGDLHSYTGNDMS
jgi:hypothetical protein